MLQSLTGFLSSKPSSAIIRVDNTWGLAEFPDPGDTKKHLLPVFVDPEENAASNDAQNDSKEQEQTDFKEHWMPDKLCKVCYSCEDPFTMFRRRHHCRLCGQVFCNQCSSHYLDGNVVKMAGLVRCCNICYEQMLERLEVDCKSRKYHENPNENREAQNPGEIYDKRFGGNIVEKPDYRIKHLNFLQVKASAHLESIVEILVRGIQVDAAKAKLWKSIILSLVREVVGAVDPNVRVGDSMDIRNYVKLKIIPGGSMDENVFIDGIVFRKNVAHKKMMQENNKKSPRILLLASAIDFQRIDAKLSSMDTLIEQEEKYMEILVEKIMSLKPDIVLVGRSVARRAQELLCNYKVVVVQNVKQQLLDRISRMTGATILTSTDHIFQQYGQQCLGVCDDFKIRIIQDDPGLLYHMKTSRILMNRIARGSTYLFFSGCPTEKGCTITLRGDSREVLSRVKKVVGFAIIVAYHLRLEVAFYADRCATLMPTPEQTVNYESEDELYNGENDVQEQQSPPDDDYDPGKIDDVRKLASRHFLSTSLNIDFRFPFKQEIFGVPNTGLYMLNKKLSPVDHQTLLVTSILMYDSIQRSKPEVKGIRYYTSHDLALGQFLVENCFGLHRREASMLDQTLSFIHRPGRLDINVQKVNESLPPFNPDESKNPLLLPITMYSYCKVCEKIVTPDSIISDETWKLSFGKFMEILFYNKAARCRTGHCTHLIRDDHILHFACENLVAKFNFVPIHPFSLRVRDNLEFPSKFHIIQAMNCLSSIPIDFSKLVETFRATLTKLTSEARAVLFTKPDELSVVISEIHAIEGEMQSSYALIVENIANTLKTIPPNKVAIENELPDSPKRSISSPNSARSTMLQISSSSRKLIDPRSSVMSDDTEVLDIKIRYALIHKRDVVLCARQWNSRIHAISRQLEVVKDLILQQQAMGQPIPHNNIVNRGAEDEETHETIRAQHAETIVEHSEPILSIADEEEIDKKTVTFDVVAADIRDNDKNKAKGNTFAKALQRLMGKDVDTEDKFEVDLSIFGVERLALTLGKKGEIVGVLDEEPGTIIAYTLSSNDYYESIKNFSREDYNEDSSDDEKDEHERGADGKREENKLGNNSHSGSKSDLKALGEQENGSGKSNKQDNNDDDDDGKEDLDYFDQEQMPRISTQKALRRKNAVGMAFANFQDNAQSDLPNNMNMFGDDMDMDMDNNQNSSKPSNNMGQETPEPLFMKGEGARNVAIEKQMLSQTKSHFKHRFEDKDANGNVLCKFQCHVFWATQFEALRQAYFGVDDNEQFIRSLALSNRWLAQGGKSGASFSKSLDDRFVIKAIGRIEMQMFLEFAPAYFEYMAKAFFHHLPTVLCKVVGVYTVGYHNRETGKKVLENIVVMENIFYQRNITRTFDLKGSSRARYLEVVGAKPDSFDEAIMKRRQARRTGNAPPLPVINKQVLLDDNFMELTAGRPIPLKHRAKVYFNKAVTNDTLFLSMVDVVDYSILVGFDDESNQIIVGIIDYMRKYDIIKKMERMGKSVGMLTGQAEPTIIQPPQYRKRFTAAMDKYFMTVPDKWMSHDV